MLVGAMPVLAAVENSATWLDPLSEPSSATVPEGPAMLRWLPERAPTPTFLRDGDLALFAGVRMLDGPVWERLGEATQIGASVTLGPRRWWLRPVLGVQYAQASGDYQKESTSTFAIPVLGSFQEPDERGYIRTSTWETDLGTMAGWSWGPLQQRVGGGLCWVKTDIEETPQKTVYLSFMKRDVTPRQDADAALGWWLATSLTVKLAGAEVGVEGRLTDARMTLFNQPVQAGGYQVGATALWLW